MKKFRLPAIVTVVVVLLLQFIQYQFLKEDFREKIPNTLSKASFKPDLDEDIVLMNTGKLSLAEIEKAIDTLLTTNPKVIGVNACHIDAWEKLSSRYKDNRKVIVAGCGSHDEASAAIVEEGNIVTRFKADSSDYFEFIVAGENHVNKTAALINFCDRSDFYVCDLSYLKNLDFEVLSEKILLVGYLGNPGGPFLEEGEFEAADDRLMMRTTPMNKGYSYGSYAQVDQPDRFDIEISAAIVKTIKDNSYYREFNYFERIFFLLLVSLLCALGITFIKTRWIIVNIVIATIVFFVLYLAGAYLTMWLFERRYYLEVPEFRGTLFWTTIASLLLTNIPCFFFFLRCSIVAGNKIFTAVAHNVNSSFAVP